MKLAWFLPILFVLFQSPATGAEKKNFFQEGPVGCSSPYPVVQEWGTNLGLLIHVTLDNGKVRTFRPVGSRKDIPFRKMPMRGKMSFGPKGIIECTIDTTKLTGISNCTAGNGLRGSCDYCAVDEKTQENKCHHVEGRLLEVLGDREARAH